MASKRRHDNERLVKETAGSLRFHPPMATRRKWPTDPKLLAALETACLRALTEEYEQFNYLLFGERLRRPSLRLMESTTQLGLWERDSKTLSLSRSLVFERPWGLVVEVLKHEMAHQFTSEVLNVTEAPHGPAFAQVCRERGIDMRAAGEPATTAASHRILSKVTGLLALAESPNPNEAEAAMSAAQRLMLKYNLEQVQAGEARGYRFLHLGTPTLRVEEWARALATILREFFFVETLWVSVFRPREGKRGSLLEVCGTDENVEMAQYVHGFLIHTSERLWKAHRRAHRIDSNRDRRKFIAGVMVGFHDKLQRERGRNQERGLLWAGDEKLKAFFRARYPKTRSVSYGTSGGEAAYDTGRKAGQNIVLHKGVHGTNSGPPKQLA